MPHANATFIERYQQLIRVLKALTPLQREQEFNMERWTTTQYWIGAGPYSVCRTTMCAAGWAACDPWFQKHGFHLEQASAGAEQPPAYNEHVSWEAIGAFFDGDYEYSNSGNHPVFMQPETVDEVITAAEKRIKELSK